MPNEMVERVARAWSLAVQYWPILANAAITAMCAVYESPFGAGFGAGVTYSMIVVAVLVYLRNRRDAALSEEEGGDWLTQS